MLGVQPGPGTFMSMDRNGDTPDNQMLLSILQRTTSDKKYQTNRMDTSRNSDKQSKGLSSNSESIFPDHFFTDIENGPREASNSQIVYTGSFRTESAGSMTEPDRLANSFEVERLLIGISESAGPLFNSSQVDTALPEDLASVALMQTDTPFSREPVVCSAGQNAPFSSLPSRSFDYPTTSALDSVFSVPTTTDSLVIDLLTHGQYTSGPINATSSGPVRQDSHIETPLSTGHLSDQFSPVEATSDSSSQSFSDHFQYTQTSSSTTHKSLNLPPPGRPGRKPGPNSSRTYKRREVPKDTEEYLIKRAKNNIAIRKCREKAKRKQEETDEKMKQLENENKALQKEVEDLRAEVKRLKGNPT